MRIRHTTGRMPDKVEMQMTPMIDVVFQLLTFFLFSLKIAAPEGDFNIKMPLSAPAEGVPDNPFPPLRLRLLAGAGGELAGIQLGEKNLPDFKSLHENVLELVGTDTGPGTLAETIEIELDFDYDLHYQHVMNAITAIAGYVDDNGSVVKLIDKIKFAAPRGPG